MAGNLPRRLSRPFRTLFDTGTAVGLTDGQLLERFATRRNKASERASRLWFKRPGPMVLRTCRGILRTTMRPWTFSRPPFSSSPARAARSGCETPSVPGCTASPATPRVESKSEQPASASERTAAERRNPVENAADQDDLAALIHEELNRLPHRYRSAIVLCDLEGRTCEEAARQLGCPIGTIGSRLSRARQHLRDRLRRRGLAPPDTSLAVLAKLCRNSGPLLSPASSPRPPALSTLGIPAAPCGAAASLALGVLHSMILTNGLKAALVLLAVLAASATGVLALSGKPSAQAGSPPTTNPSRHQRTTHDS